MKRLFLIFLLLFLIPVSETYSDIIADSYYYRKTALPGTLHRFTLRVRNTGNATVFVYGGIFLTRQGVQTFEIYQAGAPVYQIRRNQRTTVNIDITLPSLEGSYSVQMALFHTFDDSRAATFFGSYPLKIGRPKQGINAHPSRLTFGTLHKGRFMYPIPIKVRYDIFAPNSLGDEHPWALRIYTDNANTFTGIKGTVRKLSMTGLVHSSGKYTIPIKFWTLNWGPDAHSSGWDGLLQGPPPVEEDDFWRGPLLDESSPDKEVRDFDRQPWLSIPDLSDIPTDRGSWRSLVGVFPYSGQYLNFTNLTGDFTLSVPPEPFDMYLACEIGESSVHGKYRGRVILELFSP